MDNKEFGLVAAQQLLKLQDLHYGFWEDGEEPSIQGIEKAQKRYTSFLCEHIKEAINDNKKCKVLDIGCGIGTTTAELLKMGYKIDGLVPSQWMAKLARKNVQDYKDETKGNIFECNFEDFPIAKLAEKYQAVFFSESYQYVDMQKGFDVLELILSKEGTIIIFDFFRKDGIEGKSPMGGGHSIGEFYELVKKNQYTIHNELDLTLNLSPNLKLVNEVLTDRIIPFGRTLDQFLSTRYKKTFKCLKFFFRKRLKKIKYKYSSDRNEESFKKYKTYRLFILRKSV